MIKMTETIIGITKKKFGMIYSFAKMTENLLKCLK